MKDWDGIITALAGVLVLLPNTAALVTGLQLSPGENFVLLILSGVGAAILKQSKAVGAGLSDADVKRIAEERERLRREEIRKVREAGSRG